MDSSQMAVEEGWQPRRLACCLALGLLIFLTWWYVPFVRKTWDTLDQITFYALNGTLSEDRPWWRYFWAFANTRVFDLVITATQLGIFVFMGGAVGSLKRLSQFIFFYAYAHGTLWVMHASTTALFHIKRWSPNAEYTDGHRLNGLVSGFHVKDVSWCSFPGDHCVIAMLVGLFTWMYRGPKVGIPAVLLSLSVSIPRLFSGAHWLTDILVGSLFITLVLFGLMAFTPLHRVGYAYTTQPLLQALARSSKMLRKNAVNP